MGAKRKATKAQYGNKAAQMAAIASQGAAACANPGFGAGFPEVLAKCKKITLAAAQSGQLPIAPTNYGVQPAYVPPVTPAYQPNVNQYQQQPQYQPSYQPAYVDPQSQYQQQYVDPNAASYQTPGYGYIDPNANPMDPDSLQSESLQNQEDMSGGETLAQQQADFYSSADGSPTIAGITFTPKVIVGTVVVAGLLGVAAFYGYKKFKKGK